MCELPENATIRGYGLSYETEVTNGLTNQELQKKIDEMTLLGYALLKVIKRVLYAIIR